METDERTYTQAEIDELLEVGNQAFKDAEAALEAGDMGAFFAACDRGRKGDEVVYWAVKEGRAPAPTGQEDILDVMASVYGDRG